MTFNSNASDIKLGAETTIK